MSIRVRDTQGLEAILGRPEDIGLDFKEDIWLGGEECAKDIAALANAGGGQILIGVVEDSRTTQAIRFSDWLREREPSQQQQRIAQWLEHFLRPRDSVDSLEFEWIPSLEGHKILAVSIAASPRFVAVARDDGGQRRGTRFWFPIRHGRETRYMEYDEICRRLGDSTRATYLRLREWKQSSAGAFVAIVSPIQCRVHGGSWRLLRDPSQEYDATFTQMTDYGFVLAFTSGYYHHAMARGGEYSSLKNRAILVPYALVLAAWPDPRGNLCLALAAAIETDGEMLTLTTT